jgi:rubrerythrin
MKNQTRTKLVIRSILALALALAIWSPFQSSSAGPAEEQTMMRARMKEHCQTMKEHKENMMAEMKAQDADLTAQVVRMNGASDDKKLDLLAAVVTHMVEHRTAMTARMEKMHGEMMTHMMQHLHTGGGPMSQCPMMTDVKDMGEQAARSH